MKRVIRDWDIGDAEVVSEVFTVNSNGTLEIKARANRVLLRISCYMAAVAAATDDALQIRYRSAGGLAVVGLMNRFNPNFEITYALQGQLCFLPYTLLNSSTGQQFIGVTELLLTDKEPK
jgi:hypothetical protein